MKRMRESLIDLVYFDKFSISPRSLNIKDGINRMWKEFTTKNKDGVVVSVIIAIFKLKLYRSMPFCFFY